MWILCQAPSESAHTCGLAVLKRGPNGSDAGAGASPGCRSVAPRRRGVIAHGQWDVASTEPQLCCLFNSYSLRAGNKFEAGISGTRHTGDNMADRYIHRASTLIAREDDRRAQLTAQPFVDDR